MWPQNGHVIYFARTALFDAHNGGPSGRLCACFSHSDLGGRGPPVRLFPKSADQRIEAQLADSINKAGNHLSGPSAK
jgi:hypothetical protein